MNIFEILKCPVCSGELIRDEKSISCEKGHCFDIAKCGYVNMLPPGREKNSRTGDEREMVRARVNFLSAGYYKEISDRLAELLSDKLSGKDSLVLCDMGSGEGYHTCSTAVNVAEKTGAGVLALGFDASKYAAECASKRAKSFSLMPRDGIGAPFDKSPAVYFMPANIFSLPVKPDSVDAVISMFAPIAAEESARILKKGGILVVVSAGREHLYEMREIIYDTVHLSESLPSLPAGFREISRAELKYKINIATEEHIRSLFMMTPFYYRTPERGRALLYERDELTVTAHINYSFFEVI